MKRWPAQLGAITLGVAIVWPLPMLEAGEMAAKPRPSHALIDETYRAPAQRPYVLLQAHSGLRKLYAATADGLFVSPDGGRRWDPLRLPPTAHGEVLSVAVSPKDERRLYVGGRSGLWESQDGGFTWNPLPGMLPRPAIPRCIAIAPGNPEVFYVGTDSNGVFRSDDGGATWIPRSEGLPQGLADGRPAPIRTLAAHPTNPSIAYAGTELSGLYKTTDGGALWVPINRGLGLFPLRWRTGGPRLLLRAEEPEHLMAMLVRPLHSHRLQTSVYQSSDGGAHWFALEVELPPGAEGLALIEDPSDPQRVVLFTTEGVVRIEWQAIAGVEAPGKQP